MPQLLGGSVNDVLTTRTGTSEAWNPGNLYLVPVLKFDGPLSAPYDSGVYLTFHQ